MSRKRTLPELLALVLFHIATQTLAAPPEVSSLSPAGGQRGTSFIVTAVGKLAADDQWWCSTPGVNFAKTDKPTEWKVTIPPESPAGPCLIIPHNPDGASSPLWFSIGTQPEVTETEPNDAWDEGPKLEKLPLTLNGTLNKTNDVDGFRVLLKKGQSLAALVEAYSLGSLVDVMAHLVDTKGQRILTASDGRNLDPDFTFTATEDGWHTIQLAGFPHPPTANVAFTGGPSLVYRLHLSTGPVPTHPFPALASRSEDQQVRLQGIQPSENITHTIQPKDVRPAGDLLIAELPHALQPFQMVERKETVPLTQESEPNDDVSTATPMDRGLAAGVLQTKGDQDRYVITLKKGDRIGARIWAKALGAKADLHLQIEDPAGKIITSIDDFQDQPDPEVQWTATSDGPHQIRIQSLMEEHGPTCHYVLEAQTAQPRLVATLNGKPAAVLEAGQTTEFKATLKRLHGHSAPLLLRATNLPPGITAPDIEVPEKASEATLKLTASKDAPSASGPIELHLVEKENPSTITKVETDLRGENRRGTSLLDRTPILWLTVKGKPTPPVTTPPTIEKKSDS